MQDLCVLFLFSCEFGGKNCTPGAFKVLYTDFGGCFIFNGNELDQRKAIDIGSDYGLRVTLNIEQYEYMPGTKIWNRAIKQNHD